MASKAVSEVPLIDEALGDELYASADDAETIRMQRKIWHEVRESIGQDLERALEEEAQALKANLHRIRGYCSSCALRRLEKLLLDWEAEPDAAGAAQCYAPLALEVTLLSVTAMEMRYPHLRSVPANRSP